MARGRPPRDEIASAQLGHNLRALHDAAGQPTYRAMSETILLNHGLSCTHESLRQLHLGADPRTTSIEMLTAVAWFYEVPPAELHPIVGERLERVMVMVSDANDPGPDGGPGVAVGTPPGTRTQNLRINPAAEARELVAA